MLLPIAHAAGNAQQYMRLGCAKYSQLSLCVRVAQMCIRKKGSDSDEQRMRTEPHESAS